MWEIGGHVTRVVRIYCRVLCARGRDEPGCDRGCGVAGDWRSCVKCWRVCNVGRAPAPRRARLRQGWQGCGRLAVRREMLVCLYCRPCARIATRQAATGAVGVRALAVRREMLVCL